MMNNKWFDRNKKGLLKFALSIPCFLAIIVSISHVTTLFLTANENFWAFFLSVAVESGAITTLLAILFSKATVGAYLPFIVITFYQLLGNVYFSYSYISESSRLFVLWGEFINTFLSNNLPVAQLKLYLSLLVGGAVPLISLLSLHLLVRLKLKDEPDEVKNKTDDSDTIHNEEVNALATPTPSTPEPISEEHEKELAEQYKRHKTNVLPKIRVKPRE